MVSVVPEVELDIVQGLAPAGHLFDGYLKQVERFVITACYQWLRWKETGARSCHDNSRSSCARERMRVLDEGREPVLGLHAGVSEGMDSHISLKWLKTLSYHFILPSNKALSFLRLGLLSLDTAPRGDRDDFMVPG